MAVLMLTLFLCLMTGSVFVVEGGDPTIFFTWNVTYDIISPLGVPQQGILINGEFSGPNINSTTNSNVVVNVFNNLDEPFLITWNGIQQRKNPWQDGTAGTNCPILPGKNYTYHIQVKDQIGSYILRVNSRLLIPVPDPDPADDYTLLVGDFFNKGHKSLKKILDSGRNLGRCDGVHLNGKVAKGDGKDEPLFTMEAGKTYKYRICNVGLKTAINVRFQNHQMKLVEMEGSHTMQNEYKSLDVHVGQCFAVLVKADQDPEDYYVVASTRFTRRQVTATGIIRYKNGKGPASSELPPPPVASAARPNPQGSYKYGAINITRTIKLANTAGEVDGKLRYALHGVSHDNEFKTPLKLAEYFNVAKKEFEYDTIPDNPPEKTETIQVKPIVLNITHRHFVEIIFENHKTAIQSYHLSGYSFFAAACFSGVALLIWVLSVASAIETGTWSPEKRKNYNLLDAVSRHTIQMFPKSWAAILLTFDNCGMWNIRSEVWDRFYLGQQLYVSVLSPNLSTKDEYNMPEDAQLCGDVIGLPKPKPYT
ncbi:hypothetical protein V6Z11_D08G016900 [Gossypium hirsutum]